MGEGALPPAAGAEHDDVRHRLLAMPDGERLARLLRGGFFSDFLVKYTEMGDAYWKMLGLSRRVHEGLRRRPRARPLLAARERLWQGQANDAYWHGVFGGCYLPHLRRSVKTSLIACERQLSATRAAPDLECLRDDVDGDGHAEVGGGGGGVGWAPGPGGGGRGPPPPPLLRSDRFRRASLLDGLFSPEGELDPLEPWDAARGVVGERVLAHQVETAPREVWVRCSLPDLDGLPLALEKSLRVVADEPVVTGGYPLRWSGEEPLTARWAVQCNLTLSAGEAPGRYYRITGRPSLGSRGLLDGASELAMVDEWLGCELAPAGGAPAATAGAPVGE